MPQVIKIQLDGCYYSTSYPATLPQGKELGTRWKGGWMDPRTSLDDLNKRKFLPPAGIRSTDPPAGSLVVPWMKYDWIRCIGRTITDSNKTEEFGEKPIRMQICPPRIPHRLPGAVPCVPCNESSGDWRRYSGGCSRDTN